LLVPEVTKIMEIDVEVGRPKHEAASTSSF